MSIPTPDAIAQEPVDGRFRAFPAVPAGTTIADLGRLGLRVPDLPHPVMAIRDDAVEHNLATMRVWCAEHGVDLAPHGKTTLAPQLLARQLAAGAWGLTAANGYQVAVMHAGGARRVIVANEIVGAADIARVVALQRADPELVVYACADSPAAVRALAAGIRAADGTPLPVLVEVGATGRRTGVRGLDAGRAVAAAIAEHDELVLAGVEGYEGAVGGDRDPETLAAVDAFLGDLVALTESLDADAAFAAVPEIVLTAGGSTFFDRVAARLVGLDGLSRPVRVVVRSGSAVTHDDGAYARSSPLRDVLRSALELWSEVLSQPEPGLAVLGFGKRDAPYDLDLPIPQAVVDGSGARRPPPRGAEIAAVNDQHAYLRFDPSDAAPEVGERVLCGVSHPCTAFDKWSLMPLVDADGAVRGAVRTFF